MSGSNPFSKARLVDCGVTDELGALNDANDRMAVVATEPLTAEESWTPFQTGDPKVSYAHPPIRAGLDACKGD